MAKSKPTLNLVTHAATSSSTVQSPIASKSLGILRAPCQFDWKSTGRLVSISQVWQQDAMLDESTRRLVAAEQNQQLLNILNVKSTWKLVASGNSDIDGTGKIFHTISTRFSQCKTEMWSQSRRQNRKSRCEYGFLVIFYVRHSSSCSSSGQRLCGEFTFYQKSA